MLDWLVSRASNAAFFLVGLDRLSRPLQRAEAILEEYGLADSAGELVRNLSHGDQRRVEIAACMALDPKLQMLDAPPQGMSPAVHVSRAGESHIVSGDRLSPCRKR